MLHPKEDVGVVGDLQHPAPAPQCQVSGLGDADAGVCGCDSPSVEWEGGCGQASGCKGAGLQQGRCLGGSDIIISCHCVKDCLCLMGGLPDPHNTFPWGSSGRGGRSQVWSHTLGNSVLGSPVRWPETYGSVSVGQHHPQVSLAGFAEVRALLSEFCRKGRGAPGPGG